MKFCCKKTRGLQNEDVQKISWTEHITKERSAGNDWRRKSHDRLIHTNKKKQKWVAHILRGDLLLRMVI